MLQKEVICPSTSPWASPIVLVQKKAGPMRFCVDYRKVIAITRKDAYPLPRIDDTLHTLAVSCRFLTFDLLSRYWQMKVSPEQREKTTFCTPDGLFEFNAMLFGFCNAPASFQWLMHAVLADLKWSSCLVYLDDIVIVRRRFKEHLSNLRDVFERFRWNGLRLTFLGHIISEEGVATDPTKTSRVATWPVPRTQYEVKQFLGLVSYYHDFIRDCATRVGPLYKLTEKNSQFKWTPDCQTGFETLRCLLVWTPILAFLTTRSHLSSTLTRVTLVLVLSCPRFTRMEISMLLHLPPECSPRLRGDTAWHVKSSWLLYFLSNSFDLILGRHFVLHSDHGSLTFCEVWKSLKVSWYDGWRG